MSLIAQQRLITSTQQHYTKDKGVEELFIWYKKWSVAQSRTRASVVTY